MHEGGGASLDVMALAHDVRYALREYLSFEASSNVKHEYVGGQIYAMAGGTPEHAALAAAVMGQLYPQLRSGPCRPYDADLRVRVRAADLLTYPDVTVICGRVERDEDDPMSAVNPAVIIEVLSESTERYDRGAKFEHYKKLATLQHYVLVSHTSRSVDVWTRGTGDSWTCRTAHEGDAAELSAIGVTLDVGELYQAAAEPMS
jgi:Uma2 family endonuclease